MNILIIDSTNRDDEQFNEPLLRAFSKLANTTAKKLTDVKTINDIKGHGALILSGVPIDYPYEMAMTVHKPIRYGIKLDMPILGICLGHEGIGTLFGSKLFTAREKVDGVHKINTDPNDPIFKDIPSSFSSREVHEASITVPAPFELIASSNKCYNMGMKHKHKPIYGLQFHPEFSPRRPKIFSNFLDIADKYNKRHDQKHDLPEEGKVLPNISSTQA